MHRAYGWRYTIDLLVIWLGCVELTVHHETPVSEVPAIAENTLWCVAPGGIYFVPANAPKSVHYFDFTTKKIRKIVEIPKDFNDALSVSPDGRWLLYAQQDEENTDIMLVENFR